MTARDLHDDDDLLALLGEVLADSDPIPPAAIAAAEAAFDVGHLEGELAALVSDSAAAPLAGVRHAGDDGRLLTFDAQGVSIDLDLPPGGSVVLGQLDPPGPSDLELEFAPTGEPPARVRVAVDDLGRFRIEGHEGRFRLHLTTEHGPVFTPWVER